MQALPRENSRLVGNRHIGVVNTLISTITGPGWAKKAKLMEVFGEEENLSSKAGINNKYNES